MRALFAFLLAFAWSANAAISTATKPHTIDSAATPKVSYVDDNDEALLDKINELIDTTNLHNSSGAVVGDLFSSTGDMRLLIDSDNNGTNRWMVTANGATDTLWRILESGAWKGFGDGYVSGKVVASDSLVGATLRATGNLSAGGTLAVTGASTIAALSATTGSFSSTLGVTGASTLAALSATTGSFSSTLAVGGVQTNSEALVFTGSGTGGAGRIFNSAANGLSMRANTGSSYDWYVFSAANNSLIRNPTGGSTLEFPGTGISVGGTFTLSTLSSGRIPVVSTAGLITQDNLYWDATNDRLGIGSGASSPASILDLTESSSTLSTLRVVNSNSAATGGSNVLVSANGASGGDAYARFRIDGVTDWSIGADNSDGDAFVITPASTLGGATNGLRISTAGAVSMPGTLGVTGALSSGALSATTGDFSSNLTQSAGVTTISVTDNTANAVDIQEGSANYINVNTTNSAENVSIGNATTNPTVSLLGTGTKTIDGTINTDLTASRTVVTDGSSNLSVNTETGTGSHVKATSPTISGPTFSGTITTPLTASLPVFTNGSSALTTNAITGTGSVVMSTSPTLVTPALGVATATSIALGGGEAFTYGDTSFTITVSTGMTTTPSGTANASRVGRIVTLEIPELTGTSNAATFVLSGVPSGWRPSSADQSVPIAIFANNSVSETGGYAIVGTTGTIELIRRDATPWTSSGGKSVYGTITYLAR